MPRRFPCVALAALSLASFAAAAMAADPIPLHGKIDSVTIYRGQALVTRLVDVTAPGGQTDILITDLPDRVIPGSVYAESSDGIEIHSVSYREHPVLQDIRAEVKALDDQIRADQDALDADSHSQQVLAARGLYLDKLEAFAAPTAMTELSKGVLDADVLKNLTTFIFDQRKSISEESLDLSHKQRDTREQLNLHQRQRNEATGGSTKSAREALVSVTFKNAGGQLRVHYLVDQADWTASYIARGDPQQQTVGLEYDASIRQMSGEEWSDADIILSTATPSLVATAPQLDPLEIALESVPAELAQTQQQMFDRSASTSAQSDYADQRKYLLQEQVTADRLRNGDQLAQNEADGFGVTNGPAAAGRPMGGRGGGARGGGFGGGGGAGLAASASTQPSDMAANALDYQQSADESLKAVSRQLQVLELVAQATKTQTPSEGNQSVSVTYHIPRTTIPSRADEQLIQIAQLPLKGAFYKTAMPVLTSFIYDQASIVNDGKIVLLAGPVSSYQNQQFVGLGQIPTVSMGESFTLGFGIDSSLRATRELVEKTDTLQAGNRVLNFNYKLSIENFGADPAVVRLMDRVPTTKANEARITLGSTSKDVSTASDYVASDKNKGILRWDVSVPPQAIGDKAISVDHQFKVEYDKQLSISVATFTGR